MRSMSSALGESAHTTALIRLSVSQDWDIPSMLCDKASEFWDKRPHSGRTRYAMSLHNLTPGPSPQERGAKRMHGGPGNEIKAALFV